MSTIFNPERMLAADSCAPFFDSVEAFNTMVENVYATAAREGMTWSYGNTSSPYPVRPCLMQISEEADRHFAGTVPHLHSALEKIVLAHRNDSRVRDYLGVPKSLLDWIDFAPVNDYRIDLCRPDLVGGEVDSARIVEFNANCPGGIVFVPAFAAMWREYPQVGEALEQWEASNAAFEQRHWFPEFVLSTTAAPAGGPVAVFGKPGGNTLELKRMTELLTELGHPAGIKDPADRSWLDDEVGQGYLKYSVRAALSDMSRWRPFLDCLLDGRLCIVNPLPGRWIADNKLCLALMSDPRFDYLFTSLERKAIDLLIPHSRKVGDGVESAELLTDRTEWVIKGPYDTRGNAVYLGAEHNQESWSEIVRKAADSGWLAQALIRPARTELDGLPGYQDLSIVLAHGQWIGYMSRISPNLRVNVGQGGSVQLVVGHRSAHWRVG